jgi:hypothetical protein
MTRPKVVFDTNVYIRSLLSPFGGSSKLLNLWQQKRLVLYTSNGQISELIETVQKLNEQGKKSIPDEDLKILVRLLNSKAEFVRTARMHKVSPDPDDDWIIGIAIKAKAGYLVTENPKHIHPKLMPKNPPIEVLNIKEALRRLASKQPKRPKS